MRELTLIRSYLKDRTVGAIPEVGIKTLERPWLNNSVNVSCIPEGTYNVLRDRHGKYKYYRVEHVEGRSGIEFHEGNYVANSQGCILCGMGFTEEYNLFQSMDGVRKLLSEIGDRSFSLTIRRFDPEIDSLDIFQ